MSFFYITAYIHHNVSMKAILDKAECITREQKQKLSRMYKRISPDTMIQKGIPVINSLPGTPEKAKKKLVEMIARSKDTWSHPQVAVKNLDLRRLGFKPTRLAIPLPGERIGATSWRAGALHAHKMGDVFLVHKDSSAPDSVRGFIKHTIHDTGKAIKKIRNALPPVLQAPDC